MTFTLLEGVLESWHAMGKTEISLHDNEKQKKSSSPSEPMYVTEFDLGATEKGRINQVKFIECMLADFEHLHGPIVEDGVIKLKSGQTEAWSQLKARIPGYFHHKYSKSGPNWKHLSPMEKGFSFGRLILRELQAIAPTPDSKPQKFVNWLANLIMEAPAVSAMPSLAKASASVKAPKP